MLYLSFYQELLSGTGKKEQQHCKTFINANIFTLMLKWKLKCTEPGTLLTIFKDQPANQWDAVLWNWGTGAHWHAPHYPSVEANEEPRTFLGCSAHTPWPCGQIFATVLLRVLQSHTSLRDETQQEILFWTAKPKNPAGSRKNRTSLRVTVLLNIQ